MAQISSFLKHVQELFENRIQKFTAQQNLHIRQYGRVSRRHCRLSVVISRYSV